MAIGVVLFPSLFISSPSPSVHLSHVELLTFKVGREDAGRSEVGTQFHHMNHRQLMIMESEEPFFY